MRLRPALALLAWALACGESHEPPTAGGEGARQREAVSVYVVNEPLRTFAERIGGASVRVVFPAPPGVDPAFWSPDPETVAAYQQADVILLNGAGYARWVARATPVGRRPVYLDSRLVRQELCPAAWAQRGPLPPSGLQKRSSSPTGTIHKPQSLQSFCSSIS